MPAIDEISESAFLAEARVRGEAVASVLAPVQISDETESRNLPALVELVQQIPTEVREVLDDLFRAKFIAVKRVPKAALKP